MQLNRKRQLATMLVPMFVTALVFAICGCGSSETPGTSETGGVTATEETTKDVTKKTTEEVADGQPPLSGGGYQPPGFADAVFHEDAAEGNESAKVDLSATSQGYVAAAAYSDKRLKFQVICGEQTYNYDLPADGSPVVFPLQCGDGQYTFRVMENVSESKYAMLYQTDADVTLSDEFQPFLRPGIYANFTEASACVRKAKDLAAAAADENDFITAVYDFVRDNVVYDQEKAMHVTSDYVPDPDETMNSGRGICFDYASLTAAMLRSQGVPTKVIFGYVSPDDLYHAWNMFYTKESGWVAVEFSVSTDTWNRIDLTFAANGADADFIGNGENYTDVYYY